MTKLTTADGAPKVLNPTLYRRLVAIFRRVKIANQGQPWQKSVTRDPLTNALSVGPGHGGEEYQVNCPYCGDRRFRLWINHRFGTIFHGKQLIGVITCYNENCEKTYPAMSDLLDKLLSYGLPQALDYGRAATVDAGPTPVVLGPDFVTLSDPRAAPGVAFLQRRGYDPAEASSRFDVRWYVGGPDGEHAPPPGNPLVFPVYNYADAVRLECYGYQSRFFNADGRRDPSSPDKDAGEIKWYTYRGTPKSRVLFNGWNCRGAPIVALEEGPFDVLNTGWFAAVGALGSDVSAVQRDLLWRHWGRLGSTLVVALDPDIYTNPKQAIKLRKIQEFVAQAAASWTGGVVPLVLPAGVDPGKCPRAEFWARVLAEMRTRKLKGVDLVFSFLSQHIPGLAVSV